MGAIGDFALSCWDNEHLIPAETEAPFASNESGQLVRQEPHEAGDRDSRIGIYAWAWADCVLKGSHDNPGAADEEQRKAMELGMQDGLATREQSPELPFLLIASTARQNLLSTLALRGRQLEPGTDPVRGYIEEEGIGGPRIEQARSETRSSRQPSARRSAFSSSGERWPTLYNTSASGSSHSSTEI